MLSAHPTYVVDRTGPPAMTWDEYRDTVLEHWGRLLDSPDAEDERKIQTFLEQHPCLLPRQYGMPGNDAHRSVFPCAVITQPRLVGFNERVPDFMWLTWNSSNCYALPIEIEAANKRWSKEDGDPTADLRHAIQQIKQWKGWFSNPLHVAQFQEDYGIKPLLLGGDRAFRVRYVLIYGRRREATANPKFAAARAHLSDASDEEFMTYDRLAPDEAMRDALCVRLEGSGYRAVSIPVTLRLGPHLAPLLSSISGKQDALDTSPYLSAPRREFLRRRFGYWDEWARAGGGMWSSGDHE